MSSFAFDAVFGAQAAAEACAPGRVNLIGEHTDYNGGLVLPAAVALETHVWLRFRSDRLVLGESRELGAARAEWGAPADGSWLDHVRGVARVLAEEARIPVRGFELAVASDVPADAGLASSAALEVAAAHALAGAAGTPFRPEERTLLARLAHRAETGFVGVPCGIMDQFAVACAAPGAALLLDCASQRSEPVALPAELAILVIDTGVRRGLRGGEYGRRVEQCERARSQAEHLLGRSIASLSELGPSDLASLDGALAPDLVARARHVVSENQRVRAFAEALRAGDLETAGQLVTDSHASLRADFEASWAEADQLVEWSRRSDAVLGARMIGAGWGGCTLHLSRRRDADAARVELLAQFERSFARPARAWQLAPTGGARLLRGPLVSA